MTVDQKGPHAASFTKPSDLEFRLDVRAGGGYRFVSNPGTDKETAVSGDFLEVSPPERLVQTFGMEGFGKPMTQTIELGRVGGWARFDAQLKRLAAG